MEKPNKKAMVDLAEILRVCASPDAKRTVALDGIAEKVASDETLPVVTRGRIGIRLASDESFQRQANLLCERLISCVAAAASVSDDVELPFRQLSSNLLAGLDSTDEDLQILMETSLAVIGEQMTAGLEVAGGSHRCFSARMNELLVVLRGSSL